MPAPIAVRVLKLFAFWIGKQWVNKRGDVAAVFKIGYRIPRCVVGAHRFRPASITAMEFGKQCETNANVHCRIEQGPDVAYPGTVGRDVDLHAAGVDRLVSAVGDKEGDLGLLSTVAKYRVPIDVESKGIRFPPTATLCPRDSFRVDERNAMGGGLLANLIKAAELLRVRRGGYEAGR
ncbi:hypothetical protein P5F91_28950 [Nitrospirillum amazonense]|nr:hypothetical protein [Nitrospirillum amazonense]MDG3444529.1 hypothetical protein [Nitrospirillum amazonense]